jgi:hypothetical protein
MMKYPLSKVEVPVPEKLVPIVKKLSNLYQSVVNLPDATELEKRVHEELKSIDQQMMEICIQAKAQQCIEEKVEEVRCSDCEESWATLLSLREPRYVETIRGRVDFERPVYRCTKGYCRKERAPFDEELGLDPKEHLTPMVQKKAAWAGAMLGSYEKAEEDMIHQAELPVSAKEIHRIVEKVGDRALALQDQEIYERGRPVSPERPVEVEEHPETLVLEMDGTCVMGRDGAGHEVKCATVFGLDARETKGETKRQILKNRYYCGTVKGIGPFGAMVWAMCVYWGIRTAKRVVIIGDGIDWIWNYAQKRFYFTLPDGSVEKPIEILDYYHASENLTKARDAIFKEPEGRHAKEWYETWQQRIRAGDVESLIEELRKRQKQAISEKRRKELELRTLYFEEHKDRMRYPEYEASGLPIGSGAIEGTCKNLVKGRLNCVGQRWEPEKGIERMVALRVRIFNERWNDLWVKEKTRKIA